MEKEIVYEVEAHTVAKHRLLKEYLKAWAPILAHRFPNERLLYVDGFAGAGEHKNNVLGSPVVAIQTLALALADIDAKIEVLLIEADAQRVEHLKTVLARERTRFEALSKKIHIEDPVAGKCTDIVRGLVADHIRCGKPLGPALFFLDQFGYRHVPLDLLRSIFAHKHCETFSYLSWNLLSAFMGDPTKQQTISKVFGGDEWMQALTLTGLPRMICFRDAYVQAIKQRAGARYVVPFAMRDNVDRVLYWLFFATNSQEGLERMKRAMWQVDPTGQFEFSDRTDATGQLALLPYSPTRLAAELFQRFKGQTVTANELKLFVLQETPEYRHMAATDILKNEGKLKRRLVQGEYVYQFEAKAPTPPPVQEKLF